MTKVSIKQGLACLAVGLIGMGALPAGAETVSQKARRDGTFMIAKGDPAMNAAFAKAQQTLGQFIDAFDNQAVGTSNFQLKIPVTDAGKTEFFWVSDLTRKGNQFSGRLNNRPEVVQNVQYGEAITFPRSRIRDWTYVDHGKMLGNFTTCVLLDREDPAQARELKDHLGLSCD